MSDRLVFHQLFCHITYNGSLEREARSFRLRMKYEKHLAIDIEYVFRVCMYI